MAVVFVVPKDSDSCSAIGHGIESFLVAVELKFNPWISQRYPLVPTQRSSPILTISDQRVKRGSLAGDKSEVHLSVNLHTETDLGKGCVPVGRQLGFLWIEASHSTRRVVFAFVSPVSRTEPKSVLRNNCIIINNQSDAKRSIERSKQENCALGFRIY